MQKNQSNSYCLHCLVNDIQINVVFEKFVQMGTPVNPTLYIALCPAVESPFKIIKKDLIRKSTINVTDNYLFDFVIFYTSISERSLGRNEFSLLFYRNFIRNLEVIKLWSSFYHRYSNFDKKSSTRIERSLNEEV